MDETHVGGEAASWPFRLTRQAGDAIEIAIVLRRPS